MKAEYMSVAAALLFLVTRNAIFAFSFLHGIKINRRFDVNHHILHLAPKDTDTGTGTDADEKGGLHPNKKGPESSNDVERRVVVPTVDDTPLFMDESPPESRSTVKKRKKKKKMDLMYCSDEYCNDAIRERVVGDHNQIILNSPATGQVVYVWNRGTSSNEDENLNEEERNKQEQKEPESCILLLIKPNDDELMKIAANAVEELTSTTTWGKICVYLDANIAAKIKHYHGVDNERIHLFESAPTMKGYGDIIAESNTDALGYEDNHGSWDNTNFDFPSSSSLTHQEDASTPYDLIVTLGGDGLLMHASMMFQGPVPPIISIAGGSLGFLTPFSKEEMVLAVRIALGHRLTKNNTPHTNDENADNEASCSDLTFDNDDNMELVPPHMLNNTKPRFSFGLGDRICLSIRMRLDCRVINREGIVRARYNVLNEVVIDRGLSPYLVALECFCDDVHLTTVQADGVVFATPTGSTAYSMSAGGSVVHPAVPCILVTPICPHVLSFRSMVLPDHVILRCNVPDDARSHASVAFDGKNRRELRRGDSLQIQMSAFPVPTINRGDHSSDWLSSLKRNFNFNTRPRQQPL